MKILITAFACIPERGREEGRGWNIPLQLAKLGHELWVMTHPTSALRCKKHLQSQPQPNLHIVSVGYPVWMNRPAKWGSPYKKLQYLAWQKSVYDTALQLDKKHDFDVVHHLTIASLQGGSWLWRLNKPFLFGSVGGGQIAPTAFKKYFLDGWYAETLRSLIFNKLILLNPLLRKTFSQTNLVLATNYETMELAQKLGARRVELFLDGGLPSEYFSSCLPKRALSQELRLLWVGQIIPRKGLLLALEALSKVCPSIPYKLTIIGSGSLDSRISDWIENFGLEKKVDFCGRIPWIEVKNAYLKSDVFLFSSLRDSYGTVMLEAMSQALPVITLNHHGARAFIPDRAGIKVPVTNPTETVKALAQAVEYMYKNPEKRLEMGKIAYNFAKQQSWVQKAAKLSEYYEELI